MPTIIEQIGMSIVKYGRTPDRVRTTEFVTDFKPYHYIEADGEATHTTIFGKPVIKHFGKALHNFPSYEVDVDLEHRYLIDAYDGTLPEEPLRMCFLDIETEVGDGFPNPMTAVERINAICVYDNFNDKYNIFVLAGPINHNVQLENTKIHEFASERELLLKFTDYITATDPDIIISWNGQYDPFNKRSGFDYPYIYNRLVFNDISPGRLSRTNETTLSAKGELVVKGRIMFDLLHGYKKVTQGVRESYSLEYCAQYELHEGKEKYAGHIRDLFSNDWAKFVEYNRKDVELMVKINRKLHIIEYFDRVRRYARCHFMEVFYNTVVLDAIFLGHCKGKWVLPNKSHFEGEDEGSFEGALVKVPIPGLHKNLICYDFSAMYTSIICQFNMSIETVGGKDITLENGVSFSNVPGMIPEVVKKLFDERKYYKKLRDTHKKGTEEYDVYDGIQSVTKFLINSVYGGLGFKGFRLYKKEIAESITFIGRELITHTMRGLESMGYTIVISDTDSLYVIAQEENPIIEGKRVRDIINDQFCTAFVNRYKIDKNDWFTMQFEKMANMGFFTGKKKKYVLHVTYADGKPCDIIEIKNFSKRADAPQVIRDFEKEMLTMLVRGNSKKEVKSFISAFEKKLPSYREELGIPAAYNKEVYGNGDKGTPIHIRAAMNANRHGAHIQVGDKFKWLYVRGGEEVIAFTDTLPSNVVINYERMHERLLSSKVDTVLETLGWTNQTGLGDF